MEQAEFRHLVAHVLQSVADVIDEADPDVEEMDPEVSDGVMKCTFDADESVYVLSQQVPVREIWLSANMRAWHFVYSDGVWNERDTGEEMLALLTRLFEGKIGRRLPFA